MDLAALLEPRSGDAGPSGENLEYDPVFTSMELAAMPGEERQIGDTVIAAEEPDYREIREHALAVLDQSHDLRAAVFLAHAELRTNGLAGFAEAVAYIRGCLERHWDTCHPELDAEDDNDPTMRVNAVLALADPDTILRGLRLAPLSESRAFGRLSLRDIAVAEGEMPPPPDMETVPDAAAVSAAFQDSDDAVLAERLAAARAALADVEAVDALFSERTPGQGPELDPLVKMLRQVVRRLAEATGDDGTAGDGDADGGADGGAADAPAGGGAGPARAGGGAPGSITGPNDVLAAIDRITAYYERAEPSSPVPLLLARARRLVGANFLDIIKDMAPSGVENVNLVGGLAEEEESY
ncbi:MAG: type VI secretion system protein TssA [Rhodobacteraceae bacterium]|nr:type VI secretion system protein TssA [Paracoccaceae bacterium]